MRRPLDQLRPYQVELVNAVRAEYRAGMRRVLMQSPTGSGKTLMFMWLLEMALEKGTWPIHILYHRRALVDQGIAILSAHGFDYGVIAPGYPPRPSAPIQVCGIGTLSRRLKLFPSPYPDPEFLIVDEAHHAPAAIWRRIMERCAKRVLGASATPRRLDGSGLDDLFDALVPGPQIVELEELGFLAKWDVYAPPLQADFSSIREVAGDFDTGELEGVLTQSRLIGEPVEHWITHVLEKRGAQPTVVFCVSVKHSQMIAARYRAEGVAAAHLDGNTPADERRRVLEALRRGEIHVVSNCGLISEGLDIPAICVVQLLRPTKSLALYLQMCGRGSRPHSDGSHSILLDHVGNVWRHGKPSQERHWTLDGSEDPETAPEKLCPKCHAMVPAAARICPRCGAKLIIQPGNKPIPLPLEREGWLRFLDETLPFDLATTNFRTCRDWCGEDALRLGLMCQARGYAWGWLWYQLVEIGQQQHYWRVRRFLASGDGGDADIKLRTG